MQTIEIGEDIEFRAKGPQSCGPTNWVMLGIKKHLCRQNVISVGNVYTGAFKGLLL